ncbi:Cupredoxin, partial [Aulographum hederae CBS 113979]
MFAISSLLVSILFLQLQSSLPTQAAPLARESPNYEPFQIPLPIPPIKKPSTTYTDPKSGIPIDFYEIEVKPFEKNLFPGLGKASLLGYDGMFPGPTFQVEKGRETVIRVVNSGERNVSMHLHGSFTWDGWAVDVTPPGYYKDYYHPNNAARTLWFHDHTDGITARNVYTGLAGLYTITDTALETRLGLPVSSPYDVPLILTSHFFNTEGGFAEKADEKNSIFGDTFMVNGAVAPFMEVEPRRYRFRVLNAAVSRSFTLGLVDGEAEVPMSVIGSDGGLRESPVETNKLVASMAERWEIIIDFTPFASKSLTLTQTNTFADDSYSASPTTPLLQFRVGNKVSSQTGNGPLAARLLPSSSLSVTTKPVRERKFELTSHMDSMWQINGRSFADPNNRVLMSPPLGAVEKFTFSSTGMMGRGSWTHAMHLHLVEMVIISRNSSDGKGRSIVEPYEAGAIKDVVTLGDGETIEVLARFIPWTGIYMFHCHNLVHEDNGMMGAFNVTALPDFGYDEATTALEDPMDEKFRAKKYEGTDLERVSTEVLPAFRALGAY